MWGWLGPLLVTAFAGFLRFYRLSQPPKIIFDETYYAKDARSLLRHGVELDNNGGPGFIAHPPLGKWAIAVGQAIFGNTPMGWRFSSAVVGTLAVLLLARIARRLFGSTLLGCVAGLLLALDGLEFVQSRVAMLDIFLMFWVLAAFGCLLLDRDATRQRLTSITAPSGRAPRLGVRWWRWGAGACLGAACATKWSGLYHLAAFLTLAFVWDVGARRTAGVRRPLRASLLRDAPPLLAGILGVGAVVYTASWTGWFLGSRRSAWGHDTYVKAGQNAVQHAAAVVHGWLNYQGGVWHFHDTLTATHPYKSHPIGWLLLARPISYEWYQPRRGQLGCTAVRDGCAREVLAIGNPMIWWAAIAAMVFLIWLWAARRDWRAGAILLSVLVGIVPWMYYDLHRRTEFFFYALPALPFLILAITLCAGVALGPPGAAEVRRIAGAAAVGGYLVLVAVSFFYFYPILAAEVIPYSSWLQRMWFASWV